MALHLILAAMLLAAMLAVLVPLSLARSAAGKGPGAQREATALDLHRLRLQEIERDVDRGLLDAAGAEAARNEAGRLLLRAARQEESSRSAAADAGREGRGALWRRRSVALATLFGLPLLVLPLYAFMGSPNLPSRPFEAVASANEATPDIASLIGRVEAHLAEHPDDGRGYEVIAPIYMRLGRYADAARARAEALRLLGETPDRLTDLAEADMAVAGGVATSDASHALDKALAMDPKHPKARFLKALALAQDGKRDDAVAALEALLGDAPPDAPWRRAVESELAKLAPPAGGQAATIASLPAGAQNDAIRGMVQGLAARLHRQGGSADEWARLVRSYAVLGEGDNARAALAEARTALPDEASRATLLAVAKAAGLEEKAQ